MGLQSFLAHAQDDPGTQEAIRRLLEDDNERQGKPPDRMSGVASSPLPTLPPPTRLPIEAIQPPQSDMSSVTVPTRIDPRQGISTRGMSPMDAAQARLQVTQSASPQQRIDTSDPNFVEAGPPHGISRLKAAGRLFLHNLTHGGGLLGSVVGLGEGLIAPDHAQDLKHQQEIAEAQGNLNQTMENAKASAQVEDIQAQAEQRRSPPIKYHDPLLRTVKNPDGSEKTLQSDDYGQTWKDQPSLLSAPPVRTPHEPLLRTVKNPDGSESTFQSDDFGKTWTPSKLPTSAAPPDRTGESEDYSTAKANAERSAKAAAARAEAKQHTDMANALRQQEAQARKQVADLWANPVKPSMVNNKPYEEWQRRIKEGEAQAERLRTQAETYDGKRIEAETRATEFGQPLPPPKRTSAASTATAPPAFIDAFKSKHQGRAPSQSEIDAYAKAANQ